jgi:hypothetical protein
MGEVPPSSRSARCVWGAALLALLIFGSACDAVTSVVVDGADFGGATANAHCDRRDVFDGGRPSSFCQEVVNTLAASQFADDCRATHLATPGTGLCPRAGIIAGCKLETKNEDGSEVWDWYYEVVGVDAGAPFSPPVPGSASAVAQTCADRTRYADGAELAFP